MEKAFYPGGVPFQWGAGHGMARALPTAAPGSAPGAGLNLSQ
ncbi:hypothetical protein [Chitinophaga sp. CB10]|nr:hypothetical protein [Chitinophaga sp. CB10]